LNPLKKVKIKNSVEKKTISKFKIVCRNNIVGDFNRVEARAAKWNKFHKIESFFKEKKEKLHFPKREAMLTHSSAQSVNECNPSLICRFFPKGKKKKTSFFD